MRNFYPYAAPVIHCILNPPSEGYLDYDCNSANKLYDYTVNGPIDTDKQVREELGPLWSVDSIIDPPIKVIHDENGGETDYAEYNATFCLWEGVGREPLKAGFDYDSQDDYMRRMKPAVDQLNRELAALYGSPSFADVSKEDGSYDLDKVVYLANSIGRQYFYDTTWLDHIIATGEFNQEMQRQDLMVTDELYSAWLRKHGAACFQAEPPSSVTPTLEVTFFFDRTRPLHLIDQIEAEALKKVIIIWEAITAQYGL